MAFKSGLGKGIGALIPRELIKPDRSKQATIGDDANEGAYIAYIELDKIRPNPHQPRRDFDPVALQELTQSIIMHGLIQPVTVRKIFDRYELVAGERRLRAATSAGLETIPAYVVSIDSDQQMIEMAIIENVQRQDFNPLEVAFGYQRLMDECQLTQDEIASRVGKDRSTVANYLRLLRLHDDVKAALRTRTLSMGHARALLALSDTKLQLAVLREVLVSELSVRKTETLVKDLELGRKTIDRKGHITPVKDSRRRGNSPQPSPEIANTISDIENTLRHIFATQVRVKLKSEEDGTIEIDFYSLAEFERLVELIAHMDSSKSSRPA